MTSEPVVRRIGLWRLITAQGHGKRAVLLAVLSVLSALSEGLGLVLVAPLLQQLMGERAGPVLPVLLIALTALAFARAALGHWRQITSVRLRGEVVDGLRAQAWDALLHAEWRALRRTRQSDSASLLISDVERFGSALSDAFSAFGITATLIAVIAAGLVTAPLPLVLLGTLGLLAIPLLEHRQARAAALGDAIGAAYRDIHATSEEALAGLRLIKSLTGEPRAAERIADSYRSLRRAELGYWRVQGRGQIVLQAGGAAILALAVWISVTRFGAGPIQLVPLAAVFLRALPLTGSLHQTWLHWLHARPALAAVQALQAAFARNREPVESDLEIPRPHDALALDGVSVWFDGIPILSDISLRLPAGSITALVGPSGAGKSTLADVLGGLVQPDNGAMLVGGMALQPGARRAWRAQVGYVAQEVLLFPGSVRDNLLLASPGSDDAALSLALRRAAANFVFDLPGGLDCRVGQGGRPLSGGELQRLALARALLRKPALLILDEATSALDPASETLVSGALEHLRGQVTVVIIAHHGALARVADRVVQLDRGRIAD